MKARILLVVVSVILIVSNIYTIQETRTLSNAYNEAKTEATWHIYQLAKEFSELVAFTPVTYSEHEKQRVQLKYDLTWSRFDVILNIDGWRDIETSSSFKHSVNTLFNRYKALESQLHAVHDTKTLQAFYEAMKPLYKDTLLYVNKNFRLSSPFNAERKEDVQSLTQTQYYLMIVTFVFIGIVIFTFYKDAHFHRNLSLTDPLTGLYNRLALFRHIKKFKKQRRFSCVLLDLNGFKAVNDTDGHQAGDLILQLVSKRLTERLAEGEEEIFRIGGDEFAILSPVTQEADILELIKGINQCFEEQFSLPTGKKADISTSLGVSCYPNDTKDINELMFIADSRMYQMKRIQKGPSR
ncbi:GGDEF domain-containing protein [Vibrio sp.]|nr:GGDEF domain-containing protein [Vibrio viridaestus]MDC0611945.1 GGDEF domain-containing protein [Vibrio sp.]